MKEKQNDKQFTPKGKEIPIPKRGDVFKVFKKAATRQEEKKKSDSPRRPKK